MAPRLNGLNHDFKAMFKYVVLPVLIVGLAVSLTIPFLHWFRTAEANEAMFALPAPINGERAFGYLKQICDIGPRIMRYAFSPEGPSRVVKNMHGDSSGVRGAAWLWSEGESAKGAGR